MKNNRLPPTNRLLWAAGLMTKPLPDRLEAAWAAGFREMSIFPIDLKNWEAQGHTIPELLVLSKAANVRFTILDPCTKWVPNWAPPPGTSDSDLAFTDFEVDECFRMARALGVNRINLIETFGLDQDRAALIERLQTVCDRADRLGLRVGVEFMPFSYLSDLETLHGIIQAADRPNLGYTFDTWHYYRSKVNNPLLQTIPTRQFVAVQVADADWSLRGDGSLMDDLMHYRKTPTEGEFPLPEVMRMLYRDAYLKEVGVEVFADSYNAMEPTEAARAAANGLDKLLEKAAVTLPHQDLLRTHTELHRAIWRADQATAAAILANKFIGIGARIARLDKAQFLRTRFRRAWRRYEALPEAITVTDGRAVIHGVLATDHVSYECPDLYRFEARYQLDDKHNWTLSYWQEIAR